jgi:hypothetical protein
MQTPQDKTLVVQDALGQQAGTLTNGVLTG